MAMDYGKEHASSPATLMAIATPSNNALPFPVKGIRAPSAGTITIIPTGQTGAVVHPVLEGERIDVSASKITATTCTGNIVIYG